MWAVVKEVVDSEPEDVYCLQVDADDRAWTCNGLLTKNTEILLHTRHTTTEDLGETAVCNLGSVNLAAHLLYGVGTAVVAGELNLQAAGRGADGRAVRARVG